MKTDPSEQAYRVLRDFWITFRRFVKGRLEYHYGAEWERKGLPDDLWNKCDAQRDRRTKRGQWMTVQAESLLDFAHDEQLREIVAKDRNWTGIFRSVFGHNKGIIEDALHEICWYRDEVAHWRPLEPKYVRRLKDRCDFVMGCVRRAATVQADAAAPVRLISAGDLLTCKEPRELIAAAQLAGASTEDGDALRLFFLENEFENGARPDESEVRPAAVHQFFDEWVEAPENEVLMWQSYVPREPLDKGSRARLAIRYNPAALRAPRAKKRGVGYWRRQARCFVQAPTDRMPVEVDRVLIEPEGWAHVEYKPRVKGKHDVLWGSVGGAPRSRPWVRDEFSVA